MGNKHDYIASLKLSNNEMPAKVNIETGEVITIEKQFKPIPEGKIKFAKDAIFIKNYPKVWKRLQAILSPVEYKVCHCLALKAKAFTNSLEPLNDDTTLRELAIELGISKSKVNSVMRVLFDLGVYGKFEVVKESYQKYWVLNPYLSFNGQWMEKGLTSLFIGTKIEQIFHLDL